MGAGYWRFLPYRRPGNGWGNDWVWLKEPNQSFVEALIKGAGFAGELPGDLSKDALDNASYNLTSILRDGLDFTESAYLQARL